MLQEIKGKKERKRKHKDIHQKKFAEKQMNFVMEQFAIKLKKASKCGDSSARGSRWE
jgi:hypothetical protein